MDTAYRVYGQFILSLVFWVNRIAVAQQNETPQPWRWEEIRPFYIVAQVKASSEDPLWPASRVIDGDTSEPSGIWQTQRTSPKEATLELILREPTKVNNVRIFHQKEPRFYRSLDYTISVKAGEDWKEVVAVRDNKKSGWREHPFAALTTERIRIHITRSEYGYRMGLNEVEVCLEEKERAGRVARCSAPHRIGVPVDMGVIEWEALAPAGTFIRLRTRTAPDAGGAPAEWSTWSKYYLKSGEKITSPPGAWIQYEALFESHQGATPELRRVRLGSPEVVSEFITKDYLLSPGVEAPITLRFNRPMDTRSELRVILTFPGAGRQMELKGAWLDNEHWGARLVTPHSEQFHEALLEARGARTQDGQVVMWPHRERLLVGKSRLIEYLRGICEWIMSHPSKAIFVEGYNQRTILGAYEILGDECYLTHAKKWMHTLLTMQKPKGYWGTGYGDVYFADTGSALGLLINIYRLVGPDEKKQILDALNRYFHLLLVEGDSRGRSFLHPEGSLGVGFSTDKEGNITGDLNKPYTISTALTGAGIASAMFYLTGEEKYKKIAVDSLRWIFSTMREDGQIPYIIDNWNPGRKNQRELWEEWPYNTSAYVGEGVIGAWTYIDEPAVRAEIARMVKPHIEWLLRTQNPDGSWAKPYSHDQLRSHGVVNFLLWYHLQVQRDDRIVTALRKYIACLLDDKRSGPLRVKQDGIATSLVGRAVVDLIRPGTDCQRWKDSPATRNAP